MAACRRLATLLYWVEREGRWPVDLSVAKVVNVSKSEVPSYRALGCRSLLVMPCVCGAWAKLRLAQMRDWVAMWAPAQ
eukprot:14542058-Alexandrium_andersonii.AAC.1